ncbi:hypothetical protein MNBD_BACTEROID06-1704 [hydrothermal vent metagenome]|uniref:Uncharacterized protein n=1 Tax=hydrothermal vent metagenome TaxID=652676 RepID=A0A3B0UB00_9ZZZZ
MTQLNLTPNYTLILLIAFVSFFNLQAQPEKVNYKKIEKSINNKSSLFYYPNLFSRFLANDTTLTITDYRYLYYGFSFQEEYNPYWRSSNIDELNKVYQKKSPSQKDYQRLIKLSDEILSKSPFNLDAILNNFTAYEELSEIEISKKWFYKYDMHKG